MMSLDEAQQGRQDGFERRQGGRYVAGFEGRGDAAERLDVRVDLEVRLSQNGNGRIETGVSRVWDTKFNVELDSGGYL